MSKRIAAQSIRRIASTSTIRSPWRCYHCASRTIPTSTVQRIVNPATSSKTSSFHTSASRSASSPTADSLMENLQDLYATAKDEFEIAAEETTKKTVYAQDDRDAARQALTDLQEALERAVKESDPEVAKEVTSRIGSRVRELENAVTAMEESALEE